MQDEKEVMFWTIAEVAKSLTISALERGLLRPAGILDAFTHGLEEATKEHRAQQDQEQAGH